MEAPLQAQIASLKGSLRAMEGQRQGFISATKQLQINCAKVDKSREDEEITQDEAIIIKRWLSMSQDDMGDLHKKMSVAMNVQEGRIIGLNESLQAVRNYAKNQDVEIEQFAGKQAKRQETAAKNVKRRADRAKEKAAKAKTSKVTPITKGKKKSAPKKTAKKTS